MNTLTLEIEDRTIADKIIWLLQHFKSDGSEQTNIEKSISQAVNEVNMIKNGNLQAKPIDDLLNAL